MFEVDESLKYEQFMEWDKNELVEHILDLRTVIKAYHNKYEKK